MMMRRPRVVEIVRAVAIAADIPIRQLIGDSRSKSLVLPRHAAMYLAHMFGHSYSSIGRVIGDRDHTTALNGAHRIADLLERDTPEAHRVSIWLSGARSILAEGGAPSAEAVAVPITDQTPEPVRVPVRRLWTAGHVDKATGAIICNPW
jgi:hypothetical protein